MPFFLLVYPYHFLTTYKTIISSYHTLFVLIYRDYDEDEDYGDEEEESDDDGTDGRFRTMPFPFGMMAMGPGGPPPDMDESQIGAAMMTAFMGAMMTNDASPEEVMMAMQAAAESIGLFDDDEEEEPDTSLKCPLCAFQHPQCDPKGPCMTKFHCSHDARVVYTENMQCPICMDLPKEQPMVSMPCGHIICREDFQSLGGEIHIMNQEQLDRQKDREEHVREQESERSRRRSEGDNTSTGRPSFPSGPPDRLFSAMQHHFGPPTHQSSSGSDEEEEDFSDLPPLERPDGRLVTDHESEAANEATSGVRSDEGDSNRNAAPSRDQAAPRDQSSNERSREGNNRGARGSSSTPRLPPFLQFLHQMSETGSVQWSTTRNGVQMGMGVIDMNEIHNAHRNNGANANEDSNHAGSSQEPADSGDGHEDDEQAEVPPLMNGEDPSSDPDDSELDDLPPLLSMAEETEEGGQSETASSLSHPPVSTGESSRIKERRGEEVVVETVYDDDDD